MMMMALVGSLVSLASCTALQPHPDVAPRTNEPSLLGDVVYCACADGTTQTLANSSQGDIPLTTGTGDVKAFTVTFTADLGGGGDPVEGYTYYCILGGYESRDDNGNVTHSRPGDLRILAPSNPDAVRAQGGNWFNSLFDLRSGWLWVSSQPAGTSGAAAPEVLPDERQMATVGEGSPGGAPLLLGAFGADQPDDPDQGVLRGAEELEELYVGWSITTVIRTRRTRGGGTATKFVTWDVNNGPLDAKVYNLSSQHEARINSQDADIKDPKHIAIKKAGEDPPAWKVMRELGQSGLRWEPRRIGRLSEADKDFVAYVNQMEEMVAATGCGQCQP